MIVMEEVILALRQIAWVLPTSLYWLELQVPVSRIFVLLNLILCIACLSERLIVFSVVHITSYVRLT